MKIVFVVVLISSLFSLFYLLGEVKTIDISTCSVLDTTYGVYNLTADIINNASTVCINVSANHVILDCQGHVIDGTDTSSTYGVYINRNSAQTTNVTVKNCNITDWNSGIDIIKSNGNYLTNLSVSSNTI